MACLPIRRLKAVGAADTQERLLIMTYERIYTYKSKLKSRLYMIKDVGAILISNQNESDFMIFFERSDDLVVSAKNRKEVISLLQLRFNCINRNITLRVFSVSNQQLMTHHKTNNSKNKKAGIIDLPDDCQRLLD